MNRHFVNGAKREEQAQAQTLARTLTQAKPPQRAEDRFCSLALPSRLSLIGALNEARSLSLFLCLLACAGALFRSLCHSLSLSPSLSFSLSQTPSLVSLDIALLESRGKDVGELVHGRLAHSLVHLSAHALRDVSIGARLLCYRPADGSSDTT